MTLTPWPTPTSMGSMTQAGQYVNSSTNYLWGIGILIAWWLVLFMAFGRQTFPRRFAAASWLSMILAFFLEAAGLIGWNITAVFVGLTGLSVLILLVFNQQ